MEITTLLGLLERGDLGPNRVGAFLLSPENRSTSSFRKVVFLIYLEFRTMDKVRKATDSEFYTPSLEPLTF
jgi:hypothetical protein